MSAPARDTLVRPFDLLAEVPAGMTVLEASAGTGKTYTIAALATRFVAEGVPLERMLLVTFTRMASGELRERVRERLIASERRLAGALAGVAPDGDELDAQLAAGQPGEIEARRARLERALAGFDAATIETTHGFCSEMLVELGTLAEADPDVTLTESVEDILSDVVDDLYVRRFLKTAGAPPISRSEGGIIAAAAVANPDANLYPTREPGEPAAAMRWRLAGAVRQELTERKRRLGVITYDDLLGRLLRTLTRRNGPAAVEMLRRRFDVVLIDEFQDTDPTQWAIVRQAFVGAGTRLVLIADPKQAIYAFRGADVFAYLNAAREATTTSTLSVNFRSDAALLAGFDALLDGVRLGHPEIAYRRVSATPAHHGSRLAGAPTPGALALRVIDRAGLELTQNGFITSASARAAVAADVASDIVALLESGAEIEQRDHDGTVITREPVSCGDISVLVDKHTNAGLVQRQLEAVNVPAVIAGAGSVFAAEAAGHWLTLLEALERPSASVRARTAALTPLIGWDAARLAGAGQAEVEALHQSLYRWSRIFSDGGLAAMTDAVMVDGAVAARLLERVGGERLLTDIQHIGELLYRASAEEQLGLSALTAWLRQRIDAVASEGSHGDERTRRLDSDAAAVQILTIHRAKGLEWPVVYCPFLWDGAWMSDERRPVSFHRDGGRAVDVTLEGAGYEANRELHIAEERGEDLRLAYVAMTRARHRTVVHWAATRDARNSALCRLLLARGENGAIAVNGPWAPPSDAEMIATLEQVAERCEIPGAVDVRQARPAGLPASWRGPALGTRRLSAAAFDRTIDARWRRTSYSALTAIAHENRVGSEPEDSLLADEPVLEATPPPEATPDREATQDGEATPGPDALPTPEAPLPLAAMAFGPAVGTLVHRALDLADFAAPALRAELALRLAEAAGPRGVGLLGSPVAEVAAGLARALATPIDALGGATLAGVVRADRLDELDFELPLMGGDDPQDGTPVGLAEIAGLLGDFLPADDVLAGYPDRLADPLLAGVLRGYLTGSIDLALRVRQSSAHAERPHFAVIDYKTNWLGSPGEPLSARDYRPRVLAVEMQRTHYVLQGLLYSAALHRFLRWRLADYDPDRDLAGIHYLFLRGMTGSGPGGVFSWQAPPGLIPALSDLLDGRRPA